MLGKIEIEIGQNLMMSIARLLEAVNNENKRLNNSTLSPGEEVQKAFGLYLTKIANINTIDENNQIN